jgi:hypothetical protein
MRLMRLEPAARPLIDWKEEASLTAECALHGAILKIIEGDRGEALFVVTAGAVTRQMSSPADVRAFLRTLDSEADGATQPRQRFDVTGEQKRPLRRVLPGPGCLLTMHQINGAWRPSGAVDGTCMFSVRWSEQQAECWAPLHDFTPDAQRQLIHACQHADRISGNWREGVGR